jgi:hypothetical protein
MKPYKADNQQVKESGVMGYDCTETSITIYFKSGAIYHYTHASCGKEHIINMKKLAELQVGLNRYTTTHRPKWTRRYGTKRPRRILY